LAFSLAARAKVIDDFVLRFSGGNVQRPVEADFRRAGARTGFERIGADGGQHLAALDIGLR
jgi:hypothetical protein